MRDQTATFIQATTSSLTFTSDGGRKTIWGRGATECADDVGSADALKRLGLAVMKYGTGCYPWGGYSDSNFRIESGTVTVGEANFPAYLVHPAETKATQWVAGGTGIYYKFPTREDHAVYALRQGSLVKVGRVAAAAITVGQFVKAGVLVNDLPEPTAYVFLPATAPVPLAAKRVVAGTEASTCRGGPGAAAVEAASLGGLAVVTTAYRGNCYTDCQYNNCDFEVVRGQLTAASGATLPAYELHPPSRPARHWVASGATLFFKTESQSDLAVLSYSAESGYLVRAFLEASTFTAGDWVDTRVDVHALPRSMTFIFVHSGPATTSTAAMPTTPTTPTTATTTPTTPTTPTTATPTTRTTTATTTPTTSTTTATTTTLTTTAATTAPTTRTTSPKNSKACSLSPLTTFEFTVAEAQSLSFGTPEQSVVLDAREVSECKGNVGEEYAVADLALVLKPYYDGKCYPWGGYSNADYQVQKGKVGEFDAYKIHPAQKKATQFLLGGTLIYYKFSSQADYKAYKLEDGEFILVGSVDASSVTEGTYISTGVDVGPLASPAVFVFVPTSTTVPAPASRIVDGSEATECDLSTVERASLVDVAVVTMRYNGKCWTDGRYNNRDMKVERGTVTGTDGTSHLAYRVYAAATPATEFLGSVANLYFRMHVQHELRVLRFDGSDWKTAAVVAASETTPGEFMNTGVSISNFAGSTVFAFVVDDARVSIWPELGADVEGALLAGDGTFSVCARRFKTAGRPFVPGPANDEGNWGYGPGTHSGNFGIPKQFLPVTRADGREGVVWQDVSDSKVYATWFNADLLGADTIALGVDGAGKKLVGAAADGDDAIALLLVSETGAGDKVTPGTVSARVVLASTGALAREAELDASDSTLGLNYYSFSSAGASMIWNTEAGTIGVVLARTMVMAGDGLNHQGAIGFVLDANALTVLRNHGQLAGHSFANSVIKTSDGDFLSMDLGDLFPRGINLARWNKDSIKSLVAYSFKTRHGQSARSPAGATYPPYPDISTDDTQYYKWSNDVYVYTEIGHSGLVEVDDGFLVFFAGEQPSLDSSKVGTVLNAPRNAGFVKISKDLGEVVSTGPTERAGYYGFNGRWHTQTNKGINFLTAFDELDSSVSRLKTARLGSGSVLLFWEVWSSTNYKSTQLMLVDAAGKELATPWTIGFPMKLAIQDDLVVRDGKAIAYAGTADGKLMRYELCGGGGCTAETSS